VQLRALFAWGCLRASFPM